LNKRKIDKKITIVGESHSREKARPFGKVAVVIGDTGHPILNDKGMSVVKLWIP
jgi:hypothetical protein